MIYEEGLGVLESIKYQPCSLEVKLQIERAIECFKEDKKRLVDLTINLAKSHTELRNAMKKCDRVACDNVDPMYDISFDVRAAFNEFYKQTK